MLVITLRTLYVMFFLIDFAFAHSHSKYSKEANAKSSDRFEYDPDIKVRDLDKPFRMSKLNLLWTKAKVRLSEPKLKSLYSELKLHDKEELAYKHYMQSAGDKEGLKEANLRKKLIGIMSSYDLLDHFEDLNDIKTTKFHENTDDHYKNKNLFKDKKLNKLWSMVETSGFNDEELSILKEEFSHHQDKLDQYHSILNSEQRNKADNSVDEESDKFNEIDRSEEPKSEYDNHINLVRKKGLEIKDGYDKLTRLAAQGPSSKQFVEPKVESLWKLAQKAHFSPSELESLRIELLHYEKRLLKLRNLHLDIVAKHKNEKKVSGEKSNVQLDAEDVIKKQARKVEKIHIDLESRIMSRSEL